MALDDNMVLPQHWWINFFLTYSWKLLSSYEKRPVTWINHARQYRNEYAILERACKLTVVIWSACHEIDFYTCNCTCHLKSRVYYTVWKWDAAENTVDMLSVPGRPLSKVRERANHSIRIAIKLIKSGVTCCRSDLYTCFHYTTKSDKTADSVWLSLFVRDT